MFRHCRPVVEKKRKRTLGPTMNSFTRHTTQYLAPPNATSLSHKRNNHPSRPHDDIDEFLSSDLELSFASTSLNSPPRTTMPVLEFESPQPMDISPAPPPMPANRGRPRAFTTDSRLFGADMSNRLSTPAHAAGSIKSQSGSKKTQRAALPTEWLMSLQSADDSSAAPSFVAAQPPSDDAMDVDTSYSFEASPSPAGYSFPAVPHTATAATFGNLFYDYASPRRSFESPSGPQHKKRRSHSPEATQLIIGHEASSPAHVLPSSPPHPVLRHKTSGPLLSSFSKPTLQGLGQPNALKRPRRPALSTMVHPSEDSPTQSAYPILDSAGLNQEFKGFPPTRRAFSALLPPTSFTDQMSDESSSFEVDASSPAQAYAKRQQLKTIRRCDGTEDFRPLTGVTAMVKNESPPKLASPGIPRFGDNEASGKILPCHRVSEDGLMRITPNTLSKVLDGQYDAGIRDYHIIDCRFDYEYAGGHIAGAVNINTTAQIENLLFGPSLNKPKPSISGDAAKKTLLIFHCEFSAKRAPTFAKHLRQKDRAANTHVYPKIFYPEVYILEGGYCGYFKEASHRCEPRAYVTMDDPTHAMARREDLDQFRNLNKAKFGRHKSYTYGDGAGKNFLSQHQPKRNTIPSAPASLFAAATAARTRRGGNALTTLNEDANVSVEADDTDIDIGDSPCPPAGKATVLKPFKARTLVRAETYGPTRMPLGISP